MLSPPVLVIAIIAVEIRNPNLEIRNKSKAQMSKSQNKNRVPVWDFGFRALDSFRISDFVLRISLRTGELSFSQASS
jgi:hypothetical protein